MPNQFYDPYSGQTGGDGGGFAPPPPPQTPAAPAPPQYVHPGQFGVDEAKLNPGDLVPGQPGKMYMHDGHGWVIQDVGQGGGGRSAAMMAPPPPANPGAPAGHHMMDGGGAIPNTLGSLAPDSSKGGMGGGTMGGFMGSGGSSMPFDAPSMKAPDWNPNMAGGGGASAPGSMSSFASDGGADKTGSMGAGGGQPSMGMIATPQVQPQTMQLGGQQQPVPLNGGNAMPLQQDPQNPYGRRRGGWGRRAGMGTLGSLRPPMAQ